MDSVRTINITDLEVRTSRTQLLLLIILVLIFIPLGTLSMLNGLRNGVEIVPLGIGILCLIIIALVGWIVLRAHFRSIRRFSVDGLVRNDGRTLLWSELERVVNKMRLRPSGKKFIWRTEIQFHNGEAAWIIPSKVSNYAEVADLVRSLPCEHTEERA